MEDQLTIHCIAQWQNLGLNAFCSTYCKQTNNNNMRIIIYKKKKKYQLLALVQGKNNNILLFFIFLDPTFLLLKKMSPAFNRNLMVLKSSSNIVVTNCNYKRTISKCWKNKITNEPRNLTITIKKFIIQILNLN